MVNLSRSGTVVSFSTADPNIILVGFEKARNDSGLFFYNVESVLESRMGAFGAKQSEVICVAQFASSQGVQSSCWADNLAIVGMGFKW